jgi:hypothetical protein
MPRLATYQYETIEKAPPSHVEIARHASYARDPKDIARYVGCSVETVLGALLHKPVQEYVEQLMAQKALAMEETFEDIIEGHRAAVRRMAKSAADPKTPLSQVIVIERELGKVHPDQRMKPTTALIQKGRGAGMSAQEIEAANERGRKLLDGGDAVVVDGDKVVAPALVEAGAVALPEIPEGVAVVAGEVEQYEEGEL